jgi:hypothetical protein
MEQTETQFHHITDMPAVIYRSSLPTTTFILVVKET